MLNKNFRLGQQTFEQAINYATEASISLITAYFPFDVNFDSWAHMLLINVCRRQIRDTMRKKSHVPAVNLVPIDDLIETFIVPSDNPIHHQELREELLDAIDNLPNELWQQVILLRHFAEMSPKEVAEEMNRSLSAVYSLHFRAIKELRKIFWEKGYKSE